MPSGKEIITINNELQQPNKKIIQLLEEHNKIGKAILLTNLGKKEVSLESIFIEEKYQKQGYGKLLMCKIFEICDNNHIEKMVLFADLINNPTVDQFYQKLGFNYLFDSNLIPYDYEIKIMDAMIINKEHIQTWKMIKIIDENYLEIKEDNPQLTAEIKDADDFNDIEAYLLSEQLLTDTLTEENNDQIIADNLTLTAEIKNTDDFNDIETYLLSEQLLTDTLAEENNVQAMAVEKNSLL